MHSSPFVKWPIEQILGSSMALAATRRRLRGCRLTLAYHNIVSSENPPIFADASLHLPIRQFQMQLDAILEANLQIVDLSAPPPEENDPPQVVITFDDAYADALALGVPELVKRGLPATVFVSPGILGLAAAWWDKLADPSRSAVAPDRRSFVLDQLQGSGEKVDAVAEALGWPLQPPARLHRIATETEIGQALAASPRLTLGAHGWSHLNLASLADDQLHFELAEPLSWLRTKWGNRSIPWLAYPYGLESEAVRSAAGSVGYLGGLRVRGGWDRGATERLGLPRINVTSRLSVSGFRARLAGLL